MNQEENKSITQNSEADFVSFYLEQESKKSNVYYASACQSATVYYKILPGKVVYRKTGLKIVATLAGICLVLVSAWMFFTVSQRKTRLASENGALIKNGYEEILSAQKALTEFQLGKSFFGFNSAYQNFNSAREEYSYLPALALGAAQYWPFNSLMSADDMESDFKDKLALIGLEIADSLGSFLKVLHGKEIADVSIALEEI